MRLLAHYSMFKNARETTCAQVTSRDGGFFVYLYTTDGCRENCTDEVTFEEVNDALAFAFAFGGDPTMLHIMTDDYEEICDWRAGQ